MSAKTIFAGGNSTFLPALAGIAGAPPAITVSTLTASGAIASESSISANAFVANQSISAGTTITAGTGLTVTAGGIELPAGGITLDDGGIELSDGNIVITAGGITLNNGGITATNITATSALVAGTTITATGDITTTTGDITTTDGTISTATGSMSCANLTAQKLSGGIGALAGTIDVNLDAGATVSEVVTFPNFAGSDVSAYIASYNNQAVALSLLLSASYNAPNGSGTDVNLTVYNFSPDNITTTVSYSIICMN